MRLSRLLFMPIGVIAGAYVATRLHRSQQQQQPQQSQKQSSAETVALELRCRSSAQAICVDATNRGSTSLTLDGVRSAGIGGWYSDEGVAVELDARQWKRICGSHSHHKHAHDRIAPGETATLLKCTGPVPSTWRKLLRTSVGADWQGRALVQLGLDEEREVFVRGRTEAGHAFNKTLFLKPSSTPTP